MKTLLRLLGATFLGLLVVGAGIWGSLVLWFAGPASEGVLIVLPAGFAVLGAGGLLVAWRRGRPLVHLLPFALGFVAVLSWWSTKAPSNDRVWQDNVAVLPAVEVEGDQVTLRNVRRFAYRSETDYTAEWVDKSYDLSQLDTLDLIAVYWMGDAIAHTILSFGFAGEQIAISIEARKEEAEGYSALAGFFRRFELYYVVAEESDLIGLRTSYRDPPEDVYLYRIKAPAENVRRLFLQYASKINALKDQPEFYNTATTNCTTNIVTHVQAVNPQVPLSWKMWLSGYFPELVYERGALDQSFPFDALRRQSHINERARAADGAADFSRQIRENLPGIP